MQFIHVVLQMQELLNHVYVDGKITTIEELVGNYWQLESKIMVFDALKNANILHQYWLICNFELLMSKKVGDYIKAMNTTWCSNFLMAQYNKRWVEHFCIIKKIVLQLMKKLIPLIEKKNTKYRVAIHVGIKVTWSFYKLSQRVKYLQCNELFAINKSLVNMVLLKFMCVINEMLRS